MAKSIIWLIILLSSSKNMDLVFSYLTSSSNTELAFKDFSTSLFLWLNYWISSSMTNSFFSSNFFSIIACSGDLLSSYGLAGEFSFSSSSSDHLDSEVLVHAAPSNLRLSFISSINNSVREWYRKYLRSLSKITPLVSRRMYFRISFLCFKRSWCTIWLKYPQETGSSSGSCPSTLLRCYLAWIVLKKSWLSPPI